MSTSALMFYAGLGLLFCAIYPFAIYPPIIAAVGLIVRRKRLWGEPHLSVSILFCAFNEGKSIDAKIENMSDIVKKYDHVEILAYNDASTDDTGCKITAHRDVIHLIHSEIHCGKAHGMNLLANKARGDILAFTDANVIINPGSFRKLLGYFADPDVGCVCGSLSYMNETESSTARVSGFYWRFEEWLKQLESNSGSTPGADGGFFAIRRNLFRNIPDDIIDDFFTSLSVLCDGHRVVFAPDAMALERTASSVRDEFERKVRVSCRAFNCHRLLWPRLRNLDPLNLYKYISHKFMRWLSGFFLIASGLFFVGSGVLQYPSLYVSASVVVIGLSFSVGVYWHVTPIRSIFDFAAALLATSLGVVQSLRGERYQVWTPAKSGR